LYDEIRDHISTSHSTFLCHYFSVYITYLEIELQMWYTLDIGRKPLWLTAVKLW